MKSVYWIDDDFEQMFYVAQGAIKRLWKLGFKEKEGIRSKVLLIDNACESADADRLSAKEMERRAYSKLRDLFIDSCMSKDGPDASRPVYNERKTLIQDPIGLLFRCDEAEGQDAYKSLKKLWASNELDSADSNAYKEVKEQVNAALKKACIESKSVVGIDIMLLYGDKKRLEEKKLILSMELYHNLSSNGNRCFLYSNEADEDELRDNWIERYGSFYNDGAKAVIYERKDLMQRGNADVVKEIESMFDKAQESTEGNRDDDGEDME